VVHQKTTGFLGWSTKPRSKNRRWCCSSARPVWPVGTGLTGVRRCSPKTSKRRTRVGIACLASRLRRVRSPGIRLMVKTWRLPNPPLRGLYPFLFS
jgi:hypothetical protein